MQLLLLFWPPARRRLVTATINDDDGHDRGRARFELVEATIPEIHAALRSHVITAERLTRMYLKRVEAYEEDGPAINAYQHVNANAVREARQLDSLRHRGGHHRMPLFGVPVLLKDNIDTADMPTTAGSVALAGSPLIWYYIWH